MKRDLFLIIACYVWATYNILGNCLPTTNIESDAENDLNSNETNQQNQSLYVVKGVVYEIGVLTDEDDDNFRGADSQERVDLTFFDAHSNDSHIDLGSIPLPVQLNVSGQILTAIAPADVGAFSSPIELMQTIPLTGTVVNITNSDTGYYQLTKTNDTDNQNVEMANAGDLKSLPEISEIYDNPKNVVEIVNDE